MISDDDYKKWLLEMLTDEQIKKIKNACGIDLSNIRFNEHIKYIIKKVTAHYGISGNFTKEPGWNEFIEATINDAIKELYIQEF